MQLMVCMVQGQTRTSLLIETCQHVADGMVQGQTRTLNKLTDGDLSTVLWSDVGLDQNKYSYGVAIQSLVQNVEEILYICCRNVSILGLNATCISDILAGFDNATRFVFLFCQVLENLSALPLFCFFAVYFDIALSQNGYPRIRCKNTDSAACRTCNCNSECYETAFSITSSASMWPSKQYEVGASTTSTAFLAVLKLLWKHQSRLFGHRRSNFNWTLGQCDLRQKGSNLG